MTNRGTGVVVGFLGMSGWWLRLRFSDSMIPCFEETEETLPK